MGGCNGQCLKRPQWFPSWIPRLCIICCCWLWAWFGDSLLTKETCKRDRMSLLQLGYNEVVALSQRSSFPVSSISPQVMKLPCVGRGGSAWTRFVSDQTSAHKLIAASWESLWQRHGTTKNVRITKGNGWKLLMLATCSSQKQNNSYEQNQDQRQYNGIKVSIINCSHHCLLPVSKKEPAKENLTSFIFPEFNQPLQSSPWRTWIKLSLLCKLYLPFQAFPLIFSVCHYVILFIIS